MHRTKNRIGPFYQDNGVRCVKPIGNFLAPGMPGSGPQAFAGLVTDATTIRVLFTLCVNVAGPTGIQYQIDGGTWTQVTSVAKINDTTYDFTVGAINPGEVVRWRYVGGSDTIVDCKDAADIGDQEIPVENPLVLAGDHILLETGGMSVLLLEDATADPDDSIALESAS